MGSPPGRGRSSRAYVFRAALPCLLLTALETAPGGRPEPHARPVQSQPRRLCRARHAADAPHGRRAAGAVGCDPDAAGSQRRSAQEPRDARAVAHRPGPDLWPARRERREQLRLRLAQSQAPAAKTLSGPAEAEARRRSRLAGAARNAAARARPAAHRAAAVGDRATRRRCRRRWRAPCPASRCAAASRPTTMRSARSAITPAAS